MSGAAETEQQVEQKGGGDRQVVQESKRVQSVRTDRAVLFGVMCQRTEKAALWSTVAQQCWCLGGKALPTEGPPLLKVQMYVSGEARRGLLLRETTTQKSLRSD